MEVFKSLKRMDYLVEGELVEVQLPDHGFYKAYVIVMKEDGVWVKFRNICIPDEYVPYERIRLPIHENRRLLSVRRGMNVEHCTYKQEGTDQACWKAKVESTSDSFCSIKYHHLEETENSITVPLRALRPFNPNPPLNIKNFGSLVFSIPESIAPHFSPPITLFKLKKSIRAAWITFNEATNKVIVKSPFEGMLKRCHILYPEFVECGNEFTKKYQDLYEAERQFACVQNGGYCMTFILPPFIKKFSSGFKDKNLTIAKSLKGVDIIRYSEGSVFITGEMKTAVMEAYEILERRPLWARFTSKQMEVIFPDNLQNVIKIRKMFQLDAVYVNNDRSRHTVPNREGHKTVLLIGKRERTIRAHAYMSLQVCYDEQAKNIYHKDWVSLKTNALKGEMLKAFIGYHPNASMEVCCNPNISNCVPLNIWLAKTGYTGPLLNVFHFETHLNTHPISAELAALYGAISAEINASRRIRNELPRYAHSYDWEFFTFRLISLIRELGCPYFLNLDGPFPGCLVTARQKANVLKFLITELLCARILNNPRQMPILSDYIKSSSQPFTGNLLTSFIQPPGLISLKTVQMFVRGLRL